jgi:hypothetical protein
MFDHLPDPAEEDAIGDGSPGYSANETKGQDTGGEGDNPVHEFSPEHLTSLSVVEIIRLRDNEPGLVRCHGVVSNCTDEDGGREDVVEDTFAISGSQSEGKNDKLWTGKR